MAISFFEEDISYKLPNEHTTTQWIQQVINSYEHTCGSLNFIFCSDQYLHNINLEYLEHDTYTDIITFDNSEDDSIIEGDIFISIDRINDNSTSLETPFDTELHRVIIHGVLHLIGYGDKTKEEKALMREKEDAYLSLRSN